MKKNEAGDDMFLEEIIDTSQIEDSEFECKSKLDRNNVVGWLKTFTGFANANGGTIYVGVEDKTNKLIGFQTIIILPASLRMRLLAVLKG